MRVTQSIIGSGTTTLTSDIRPGVVPSRGTQPAQGIRDGMNVVVINPEDLNSSPFFASSGVMLAADTVTEIPGLLPLRRTVQFASTGPGWVFIGFNPDELTVMNGFPVPMIKMGNQTGPGTYLKLNLLPGVQIFAVSSGEVSDVRWTEY